MPKNKSAATRYRIIDNCLNNKQRPYPSKKYLADKVYEKTGTDVSESTIEKDINHMKKDPPLGFSAPIEYSQANKGYYYGEADFSINDLSVSDDEWTALKYASALLFQYSELPMFRYFKEAIEKIDLRFGLGIDPADPDIEKYIHFEQHHSHTGYQWLGQAYASITNSFGLKLVYDNIYKNEIKEYQIQPCLLKENRNRWYLIAWVPDRKDYLTFALDRIRSMDTIEKKQKPRTDFKADHFFRHTVGIMEGPAKPRKIQVHIKAPFDRLVELNPIHHSQKIKSRNAQGMKIELNLLVNDELCLRLLALGPHARVLSPASLADKMKQVLRSSLKQYK